MNYACLHVKDTIYKLVNKNSFPSGFSSNKYFISYYGLSKVIYIYKEFMLLLLFSPTKSIVKIIEI